MEVTQEVTNAHKGAIRYTNIHEKFPDSNLGYFCNQLNSN